MSKEVKKRVKFMKSKHSEDYNNYRNKSKNPELDYVLEDSQREYNDIQKEYELLKKEVRQGIKLIKIK